MKKQRKQSHFTQNKGVTFTIDAAGCQTAIVDKIRDGDGNYVLALKGNQGILRDEAENFFTQARSVGHQEAGCQVVSSTEKGHGKIEEREIVVINQLDWLESKSKWRDLTSLIEVTSRRTVGDKTSEEQRYYILNQAEYAKILASVKAPAIEQIALRVVLNQYNPQRDFSIPRL